MKDQWTIEHEWDIAKLLVTNCDYKMLFYTLPQYGLYLQSIAPIPLVHARTPMGLGFHFQASSSRPRIPHVAVVRTQDKANVSKFIMGEKQFEASKIFKHGFYFPALEKHYVIGFVCNTVKNMVHLCKGKTIRIVSKNRELRDMFYEKAVSINEEDNTECIFDYDEYDYVLDIRPYKRLLEGKFHTWAVVTLLYGEEMTNHWNMETKYRELFPEVAEAGQYPDKTKEAS